MYHGTSIAEQQDAADYDTISVNLLKGNGFLSGDHPTDHRPPVYPLFLASIYYFFGHNDFAVKIVQCIISALTVLLAIIIANLIFDSNTAIFTGIFTSIYPPFVLYSNIKLTETLFTFFLLTICFLLIKAINTGKMKYYVYLGITHGIATLCRSTLILLPLFSLMLPLILRGKKNLLKGILVYLFISSGIISVWTIRNYITFNIFMPVNIGSGYLMWHGMLQKPYEGDKFVDHDPNLYYPEIKNLPRRRWEQILTSKVLEFAAAHPLSYFKLMLRNLKMFWILPVGKVMLLEKSNFLASAYQILYYLFLLVAAYGIYSARGGYIRLLPVLIFLVYISVMHSIIIALPRLRLPFESFLLIFFAHGVVSAHNKFRLKYSSFSFK